MIKFMEGDGHYFWTDVLQETTIDEDVKYLTDKIYECMMFIGDCEDKWFRDSSVEKQMSQMQMVYSQLESAYKRLNKLQGGRKR